ncbi:MAG: DUF4350 domain-containing protein [Halobacteriota archaeon]
MKLSYALIAAVVIVALLISVPILNTTKEDFSTYNTAWNGASDAKALASSDGYTTSSVLALSEIGTSGHGVLFMLNPNSSVGFSASDASTLQSFVQNGGVLVLANNFGNGNAVLSGLGVLGEARFNGSLLEDNVSKGVNAALPLITDVTASGLTAGVHELYFNYGTALDVSGTNVTVLARSAPTSYLLAPAGGNATVNATTGAHPVLATFDYGNGRIVLLSDPSVFSNDMLGQADNQQLLTSMFANLTGGNTAVPIMFDESHFASPPVFSLLYDRINADDTVKYTVVVLFSAAFVIGINATALVRRRRKDMGPPLNEVPVNEEAVITDIVRAHPEWRRSRVKGFLKQLQQRRRIRRGNGK